MNAIPEAGFVRKDVQYDGQRYIIFATSQQLHLLAQSKTWYADGTFKCVKAPFRQLFSIYVFIRQGDCMKQVPVCFALMTRRGTADYVKVITCAVRHTNILTFKLKLSAPVLSLYFATGLRLVDN